MMLVQVYTDGLVRIFGNDGGGDVLCDFEVSPPLLPLVDQHLKRLRMRRRTAWHDYPDGGFSEAQLRFKEAP